MLFSEEAPKMFVLGEAGIQLSVSRAGVLVGSLQQGAHCADPETASFSAPPKFLMGLARKPPPFAQLFLLKVRAGT